MKISCNKKLISFVVCIMLVLTSVSLLTLPKTYAKYAEANEVTYTTNLYNLYNEFSMKLEDGLTYDTANFRFSFKPNVAVLNNESDKYEVVIPNTCRFTSIKQVTAKGETALNLPSSNSFQITYNPNTNKDVTNIFHISCTIAVHKDLNIIAKVNETINGNENFQYINFSYTESYQTYMDRLNGVIDKSLSIPRTEKDMWAIFEKWIKDYSKYIGDTQNALWSYVTSVYTNADDLKNPAKADKLLGFNIKYSEKEDEYTFNIESNFLGYAKTYLRQKSLTPEMIANQTSVILYFSAPIEEKAVLDLALYNYLNLYVYDNKDDAKLVYDYIHAKGRIYSVIYEDNKNITGITKGTTSDAIVITKSAILSAAETYLTGMPTIKFASTNMMLTDLQNALKATYSDLNINEIRNIYNAIKTSATKNNTDSGTSAHEAFTDYFVVSNANGYYLVKVSSDGVKSNKVSVTTFTAPAGMKVEVSSDTKKTLKLNITYTNESDVMNVVNDLNGYFGVEATIDVITNTASEYSVTYTINK